MRCISMLVGIEAVTALTCPVCETKQAVKGIKRTVPEFLKKMVVK